MIIKKGDKFESLTFMGEVTSSLRNGRKRLRLKVKCNCGDNITIAKDNWGKQKQCKKCNLKKKAEVIAFPKGKKFGKLTITGKTKTEIKSNYKVKRTVKYHQVECSCGNIFYIKPEGLKNNIGCKKCAPKRIGEKNRKHGMSKTIEYRLLTSAKSRCKKNGYEFNLTLEDIKIPKRCPVFGIELDTRLLKTGTHRALDNSPALDRVDSSKGYIEGNIAVISYLANSIKNDGTADEHEAIANFMRKHEK